MSGDIVAMADPSGLASKTSVWAIYAQAKIFSLWIVLKVLTVPPNANAISAAVDRVYILAVSIFKSFYNHR